MLDWVALGLLIPAAVVMLGLWRQHLALAGRSLRVDRLLTTTWCPLLASAGLLGLLWDRGGSVGSIGGFAVGSGVMIFAIFTGAMLLATTLQGRRDAWDENERVPLAWPIAGVILVLIGSAGRVPHTVGLIVLAMGIIMLWLNTLPAKEEEGLSEEAKGPPGPIGALLAGLVLAACARMAPGSWLVPVSLLMCLVAVFVVFILGRHRGGLQAIRASGWFAVLLPALGLGLLGQDRLLELVQGGRIPGMPGPPPTLTGTVGLLVPGLVLLTTTFVLAGFNRWSSTWRAPSALALVVAGILGLVILVVGVGA